MRLIRIRPTRLLPLAALLAALLGGTLAAAPAAEAQTPPRGPLAAPADQPVGMVRVAGPTGGPITFPIFGVSAGVQQLGTTGTGTGTGTGAGRANFADVAVIKAIGAATPPLWVAAIQGRHLMRVDIAICRAGADCAVTAAGAPSPNAYLVYSLEDALISSVQDGGEPIGGTLSEVVSFAFGQFTVRAGMQTACWDLIRNVTC